MEIIGLTTCPEHASGNVGDKLITEAAIEMIKDICENVNISIHFRRSDFSSRMEYLNAADAILLLATEITERKMRPRKYRIAENLSAVQTPIIPIAGTHTFFPGDRHELLKRQLKDQTRSFIDVLEYPANSFPARTEWVKQVLSQNGYNAVMTGDPAWYDPNYIGEPFHSPDSIDKLVFTTPHDDLYLEQAKRLIRQLTNEYQGARRIVSLHSAPTDLDRSLVDLAEDLSWEIQYNSHDTSNLEFYKESDIHIGYRKHGHLAHLRWRRPSIVLAEDSRAQGLTETLGTGGFSAFESRRSYKRKIGEKIQSAKPTSLVYLIGNAIFRQRQLPDRRLFSASASDDAIDDTISFAREQQRTGWSDYDKVREKIDETYRNKMMPYLKEVLPTG